MNETTEVIQEILESLGLDKNYRTDSLILLETGESKYVRDFKLNFTSTLTSQFLNNKECGLIGLSIAVNNNNKALTNFFTAYAEKEGASAAEIAEAVGVLHCWLLTMFSIVSAILRKRKNTARYRPAYGCS